MLSLQRPATPNAVLRLSKGSSSMWSSLPPSPQRAASASAFHSHGTRPSSPSQRNSRMLSADLLSAPFVCRPTTASIRISGLAKKATPYEFDVANAEQLWMHGLRTPDKARPDRPIYTLSRQSKLETHTQASISRLLAPPPRSEINYANGEVEWRRSLRPLRPLSGHSTRPTSASSEGVGVSLSREERALGKSNSSEQVGTNAAASDGDEEDEEAADGENEEVADDENEKAADSENEEAAGDENEKAADAEKEEAADGENEEAADGENEEDGGNKDDDEDNAAENNNGEDAAAPASAAPHPTANAPATADDSPGPGTAEPVGAGTSDVTADSAAAPDAAPATEPGSAAG